MARIVHNFLVTRDGDEIELKASFEISEGSDCAELVGSIFTTDDDDIKWDGRLTRRERTRIEAEAYEAWEDQNSETRHQSMRDDSCLVDPDFDDDMAVKVEGVGQVFW